MSKKTNSLGTTTKNVNVNVEKCDSITARNKIRLDEMICC